MKRRIAQTLIFGFSLVIAVLFAGAADLTNPSMFTKPALAQTDGSVPGRASGSMSDAEIWRQIRHGDAGTVSIPDQKAAILVQSEGDNWRAWRNGPILIVGAIMFWLMFFVVYGFYQIRGKVRVKSGLSGRKILRFKFIERFGHWLTAGSFLILAVTGVNLLYGKYVLIPILGKETFAALTQYGKYVHNYVAFAFMIGLVVIFVTWVRDNLWDRYDFNWIKKGGGLLLPDQHPTAAKFNFGQKTVFWAVMGCGLLLSITGLNLMFPFMFTDIEGMQWTQAIHATISQIICMLMVAHIYIGTVGMEGAYTAMSTGYVDENWAKEHHGAWFEDAKQSKAERAQPTPEAHPRQAPAE